MTAAAFVVDVGLVAIAVVVLGVGASQFVTGAERIARRVRLPGLVIGLTITALGTSAPEFAVTLDAALTAKSNISVGNVVGSNIFNLGFILGGVALIRPLSVSSDLVRRDSIGLVAATGIVFALLLDLHLGRFEGGFLLVLFALYFVVLFRTSRGLDGQERPTSGLSGLDGVRTLGGLAGVLAGAHLLVLAASDVARVVGISEWVIGVTVVAAGTSMPELATSFAAARRGRTGLSAGNLVGSCLFNCLGVLGLATVLRPLSVVPTAPWTTLWLLGITAIATVFFWSNHVLSRVEGGVLVGLSAANWIVDFWG